MADSFKNLRVECAGKVYEPAEDSTLLAKTIIINNKETLLDVGTGSGFVALSAAGRTAKVLGVDIDPEAIDCARGNALNNDIDNAEFCVSDLFENVEGKFDVITFNPPYLPSGGVEDNAVDGGENGIELVERFLTQVSDYLNPGGRVYLLVSSLNNIEKVGKMFEEKRFTTKTAAEEKLFFETLYVIQASY
ncbi:MAG: HemK2/MTQ2 family protein methyltransferase [Methanobacteriota archaeon]